MCELIASGNFGEPSLSMKCFKYDALLITDYAKWTPYILDEIKRDYTVMLDCGATSVWETIDGAAAFDGAGSLCHGWSAMPAYYYHILCMVLIFIVGKMKILNHIEITKKNSFS